MTMAETTKYQSQANGSGVWFDLGPWYPTLAPSLDYAKMKKEKEGFKKVRVVKRVTVETVAWVDEGGV